MLVTSIFFFSQNIFYPFKTNSIIQTLMIFYAYDLDKSISCFTLYHTIPTFNDSPYRWPFKNIVGKGQNAGNKHFLLFPVFCILPQTENILSITFNLPSTNAFNLAQSMILFGEKLSRSMWKRVKPCCFSFIVNQVL